MITKIKDILVIALSAIVIFGFFAASLIMRDSSYSFSERRALAQAPELNGQALLSGSYMSDFESYVLDQFPMRDSFRTLKALAVLRGFWQCDNNGFYTNDNYVSRLEYPLKDTMIDNAISKFSYLYENYLRDANCQIYLSIIPDKNYFQAPLTGHLMFDYEKLVSDIQNGMPYASYIDIFDKLSLEDYYMTDQHWRQEMIGDVAQELAAGMGAVLTDRFTENTLEYPFYGTYYGQSALPLAPDTLVYLTSDLLDGAIVTSYDTGMPVKGSVYNMEKAAGKDPYEIYLSGADALTVIENPAFEGERELVIFRDSFGSSITPLMLSGYSKITLVDLRYVSGSVLGHFVDFEDADVLFLYSTLILNNSISFK